MNMPTGCLLLRGWRPGDVLLSAVREAASWSEDRATGWLLLQDRAPVTGWPRQFAAEGPVLLDALEQATGTRFTACCFQGYRDGTGCAWHYDRDWAAQAVLSLGVTRTFGLRRGSDEIFLQVGHGDLLFMPPGFQDHWEHCVPVEDVPGERYSLVFRSA